jgi:hypothetical protein
MSLSLRFLATLPDNWDDKSTQELAAKLGTPVEILPSAANGRRVVVSLPGLDLLRAGTRNLILEEGLGIWSPLGEKEGLVCDK